MPLEFIGDAIALSGEYGSKRKTEIISDYYRFWLGVVARNQYVKTVNIVEMDAGTGELHFKDTGLTSLGSAGHALELRYNSVERYVEKLNIVLIEEDSKCRKHMDKVIRQRWKAASLTVKSGRFLHSEDGAVSRFESVNDFLAATYDGAGLGISLFYFDPLLSVDWSLIDQIAKARIVTPYKTGTEFLVFFFTSDWITGRKDPYFHSLPKSKDESKWTKAEKESADIADRAFGCRDWTHTLSSRQPKKEMESELVKLYKSKLRKWFRFVEPLPFVPKTGQIYHVFCCSNYDVGMGVVRSIYKKYMQPYGLKISNANAYKQFRKHHIDLASQYSGRNKPPAWRILWHVMRNCPDGLCDGECANLQNIAGGSTELEDTLKWLKANKYLKQIKAEEWPWNSVEFPVFVINWDTVRSKLDIERPDPPIPLEPP